MAKIPDYKKDEHTGAVIFKDSNAYQQVINAGFNIAQPKQVIAF